LNSNLPYDNLIDGHAILGSGTNPEQVLNHLVLMRQSIPNPLLRIRKFNHMNLFKPKFFGGNFLKENTLKSAKYF